MANTYYLPSESGWASGNYKLRLKVVQTYNSSSNQSSVTITPQFAALYEYGTYNLISGLLQYKASGESAKTTLWNFALRTSSNNIPYRAVFASGQAWTDLTKLSTAAGDWPTSISKTWSHGNDGTLSVTFYAEAVTANSGSNTATFTGNQAKNFPGTARTYTLTITKDGHTTVTAKRGSTTLSNGATITYGDVLTVTAGAASGYQLKTFTINGASKTSPASVTVTGNVSVAATSEAMGLARIRKGGAYATYACYIRKNNAWVRHRPYIRKNGQWVPYG